MFNKLDPNDICFSAFDIELKNPLTPKHILTYVQEVKHNQTRILDVQAFRHDSVFNQNHLLSAVWHAWNGFKNNYTISNSLSIEFLLYLSGQRQIAKAIEFFGLKGEMSVFSMVIFHENELQKEELFSLVSKNQFIERVSQIKFPDYPEKRMLLAKIFNFEMGNDDNLLKDEQSFLLLENYILTVIANVVFETSQMKVNQADVIKQKK